MAKLTPCPGTKNFSNLSDFVEDLADEGAPTELTALLIASVRRDYFLVVQNGTASPVEVTRGDLPSFSEEFDTLADLSRIIAKAIVKLRGELHPDVMFSCGEDKKLLRKNGNIHPADFLLPISSGDGDPQKMADFVRQSVSLEGTLANSQSLEVLQLIIETGELDIGIRVLVSEFLCFVSINFGIAYRLFPSRLIILFKCIGFPLGGLGLPAFDFPDFDPNHIFSFKNLSLHVLHLLKNGRFPSLVLSPGQSLS